MKKTKITTAIIAVLALTVLASEAFAGPGGGRGRGGRQGWGRGMGEGARMGPNFEPAQRDNIREPRGQYCPYCQRPIQNIRNRQSRGPDRFGRDFVGRDLGRFGRGFQGRGPAMLGRGGRDFQRRNIAPQGRGMNDRQGWPGPRGIGRPSPGMRPRQFTPEDTVRPMPPRGRGWAPGQGRGWRQGMGPGWGQNPKPETAPDANAPKPPIVENQTERPQGE